MPCEINFHGENVCTCIACGHVISVSRNRQKRHCEYCGCYLPRVIYDSDASGDGVVVTPYILTADGWQKVLLNTSTPVSILVPSMPTKTVRY